MAMKSDLPSLFLPQSYLYMTYSYTNGRKVELKEESELTHKNQLLVSPVHDPELCHICLTLKTSVPNNTQKIEFNCYMIV